MNAKILFGLGIIAAAAMAAPVAIAAPRGTGHAAGSRSSFGFSHSPSGFSAMSARPGVSSFNRNSALTNRFNTNRFSTTNRSFTANNSNHHHHHHHHNNVVFIGDFGYPFGYPWYWYDWYPYGYSYDQAAYADYDRNGGSLVAEVQSRLADGGYYHGAIDGVMGPQTRRAIRSYERAHGLAVDGMLDRRLLATMGVR